FNTSFNNISLTNYGTVNWFRNGYDLSGNGATIFNFGLWDTPTNATMSGILINNYGTFRKSGGTLNNPTVLGTFNNYGIVDDQAGQLFISTCFDSGLFNTSSNAEIYLFNWTLTGNPSFAGTGYIGGAMNGSNAVLHGVLNYATTGSGAV